VNPYLRPSVGQEKPQRLRVKRPKIQTHLRAWRLYRGLTHGALAERSGLAKITIMQIEKGSRDFTGGTLGVLAAALETTPSGLLSPPNDKADIWSVWDDLREQGKAGEAVAVLRAIRDSGKD